MTNVCADLTDVTLADADTNSILTDNVNRAIQGNEAMQVMQTGDQCKFAPIGSGASWCFQKNFQKNFDPEKVKKRASKVAHNWPRPFFPTVQPRPQPTAQN